MTFYGFPTGSCDLAVTQTVSCPGHTPPLPPTRLPETMLFACFLKGFPRVQGRAAQGGGGFAPRAAHSP